MCDPSKESDSPDNIDYNKEVENESDRRKGNPKVRGSIYAIDGGRGDNSGLVKKGKRFGVSKGKLHLIKKQPSVLIFDSLKNRSRCDIITTLIEYIQVEWDVRKSALCGQRTFGKNVIKGNIVRVPQQNNSTDCGTYVLHYVECFYKQPPDCFTLPIKGLEHWFTLSEAEEKRRDLQRLISLLTTQLNPSLHHNPTIVGYCVDQCVPLSPFCSLAQDVTRLSPRQQGIGVPEALEEVGILKFVDANYIQRELSEAIGITQGELDCAAAELFQRTTVTQSRPAREGSAQVIRKEKVEISAKLPTRKKVDQFR